MAFINFQPKDYFNTKLFTGTGSSNSVTGVGFQPDWCWIKNASSGSNYSHQLYDAIRGVTKRIFSDVTTAEETDAQALTAFGTDGFSVGTNVGVNSNGSTIVSWNWKANGQGSSNTDGSINTTYTSASTTSGFSIVKYTGNGSNGATVGHGLGAVPAMIAVKNLGGTDSWQVYHKNSNATPEDYILQLNTTGAAIDNNTMWNDTAPTSSVFSIGTDNGVNQNSANYIAYCFAEKKGFSKFGSYTGNGNADGSFIYTGFRSAMIIFKQSSASGEKWYIYDNKRNPFNITNSVLFPSASDAESSATTGAPIDILSNGFKLRGTDAAGNGSGSTYIYMAFSDQSIVSSNGVPAVAR